MAKKKVLLVYYSYDEFTKKIAEAIAHEIGADIQRLVPKEKGKRSFYQHVENPEQFEGYDKEDEKEEYIWGQESVEMDEKPEIEKLTYDPDNYQMIILGTPVWALTYAPPFNTFFDQEDFVNKDVALFCTHEGMAGDTFDDFEEMLEGNNIISVSEFQSTNKLEEVMKKARDWAKKLLNL
ncbi:MAG: flavodoxin [Kosmotoga sp.]|nr:MAG: flavodoxin [Kosmotoga sp.]